jgi:hypothetical protein
MGSPSNMGLPQPGTSFDLESILLVGSRRDGGCMSEIDELRKQLAEREVIETGREETK